ncbi:MAG: enoyl-CoA hydratase/isomerase family protein, partial [Syntrophomonadaceae bacterium]|nr:enoyl-CoA hydratase/isomerase family protein [Syntrophomonadaceae bacterium]
TFPDAQAIIDWFMYEEETLLKVFTCKKPVVAAINGHATAAGMIIAMGCDHRIAVNHPKIKMGMTEIKIGLALTPAEAELMRFGLSTDKNYREIIMRGELVNPEYALGREIIDELADDAQDLMAKAKAKVVALIDTPGRPFINLKLLQKQHAADWIRDGIARYDFNELVKVFTDPEILATLNFVKQSLK